MYECGMRLGTEVFSVDGLKQQAKCYLACLNCLKLVLVNWEMQVDFSITWCSPPFSFIQVNSKYAWIVKPVPYSAAAAAAAATSSGGRDDYGDFNNRQLLHPDQQQLPMGMSPKRNSDGEELLMQRQKKPKMEVLEMEEIEKEFELISARLKLVKKLSSESGDVGRSAPLAVTGPGLSPGETTALLIQANLYEDAIHISRLFDLDTR